jgi:hypothetical protein
MNIRSTVALLGALLFATAAFAQDCDRTCLTSHLNVYLDAVAAHNPAAGNLWVGFRQTENAVAIPEGQGVWASVTGLGSVQRRYLDPVHPSEDVPVPNWPPYNGLFPLPASYR